MDNQIWTFFHRSGRYLQDFTPVWQRYLCYGGRGDMRLETDKTGHTRHKLTLRIPERFSRLLDDAGVVLPWDEALLAPGDRVAAGNWEIEDLAAGSFWEICAVTPETGVCGMLSGYRITAQ